MPIFGASYKSAAKTDLERATRELEEKKKKAATEKGFQEMMTALMSNVAFAQRLSLISSDDADAYRERIQQAAAQRQQEAAQKTPAEQKSNRPMGNMTLAEIKEQIAQERAAEEAQRKEQQEQQYSKPAPAKQADEEGSRQK